VSRSKLQVDLERRLSPDMHTKACPRAARVLLLKDLGDDLQIGLVIQRAGKRGKAFHVVDLGVRIPSVESVIEEYEEQRMKEMGFPDPRSVGWLTFWTTLESPTGHEGSCDDPAYIESEFHRLQDQVGRDLTTSKDHYHEILSQCDLPAWATMPGSAFLVIRTLACCPAKRSNVETLMQSCSDMAGNESNVYRFMDWFAQRRS